MPPDPLFLDASYVIALAAPADQYHQRARLQSQRIRAERTRLVTTTAVAVEIGNALAKQRLRSIGARMLRGLRIDPTIELLPLSDSLYEAGVDLYLTRPDKDWGLTDCISFVVMRERGITDALTSDDHFRQAGFRPLLQSGL